MFELMSYVFESMPHISESTSHISKSTGWIAGGGTTYLRARESLEIKI